MTAALQARNLAPHFWRSHVCLAQAATEAGKHQLAAQAAAEAVAMDAIGSEADRARFYELNARTVFDI